MRSDICGAPWVRVVDVIEGGSFEYRNYADNVNKPNQRGGGYIADKKQTVGWRPTCEHDAEPIPATVLDPFVGSGTTLQVTRQLGRSGIGLDLSMKYLTQNARKRLELDRLDQWQNGIKAELNTENLPLFEAERC